MDTSNEGFFRPDDKVLLDYNEFRNQFGKDEFVVIAINGPDVFDMEFLQKLRLLHQELDKTLPYIDEITSLINIRNTRGEDDELIVEDFLETWPKTQADLDVLGKRAAENALYENFILNKEGTMTSIIVKPLPCNPDTEELFKEEGSCQPMTNVQNRDMVMSLGVYRAFKGSGRGCRIPYYGN